MAIHKLVPYWIRVREIENPDSEWDQTNIHEEESQFPCDNLADYFWNFCQKWSDDVHINEEDNKTFTVSEPVKREGNTIEGRFKSGEWGINADFWDVNDHERIEDAREENHSQEIPYYFLFHIPDEDNHHALLILRKFKNRGVKTDFKDLFLPRSREIDIGDGYMTIEPHYSDQVEQKLDEADRVANIRFRGKDSIPARQEYADKNNIKRVNDDIKGQLEVDAQFTLRPRGNESSFRKLAKGLIPGKDDQNFDYGSIEEKDFSSATVTVTEGESDLTFSLWEEKIQMRMDLDPDDDNLEVFGGHPTPYTLGRVARQLTNDLMRDVNTSLSTEPLIEREVGIPDELEIEESEQNYPEDLEPETP